MKNQRIKTLLERFNEMNPNSGMSKIRKFLRDNGISDSEIDEYFGNGSAKPDVMEESMDESMDESATPDLDDPTDLPDDIKDDF